MTKRNVSHEVKSVKLGTLHGATYNPRDMPPSMMSKLKASLRKFGFVEPIVFRPSDGLIIGGHQRVAAWRENLEDDGLTDEQIEQQEVQGVAVEVTDLEAKTLNLALNKITGQWNYDMLAGVLNDLSPDEMLSKLSGFDMREIKDIVGLVETPPDVQQTDDEIAATVEQGLAAQARRFVFKVGTDAEAAACTAVLRAYGMTGPGNAAAAFVAALRATPIPGREEAQDPPTDLAQPS